MCVLEDFHGVLIVAFLVLASVRVLLHGCNSMIDHVPHGGIHLASVAALVSILVLSGAVNKLLGREIVHSPLSKTSQSLQGAGCRESPAGPAHALVLDSGDCTLAGPVDAGRQVIQDLNFACAFAGDG